MAPKQDQKLWHDIVDRVNYEWRHLHPEEKDWVSTHGARLATLQRELHQLFLDVGGADLCCDCNGSCCGHGKFHPNLTNLLICKILNFPIPDPDFSADCPYIGDLGCLFPPEARPYNCVSFICEQIEELFAPSNKEKFYALENEIRGEYALFVERYTGASMRGLLIRGELLSSYLGRR
ncbi:MAG: hypothetical protein C0623_07570 [Desulfuromonas sp.]|nr:MAG: hypothetical protein C0623_07570 [Desulfuromonas sp.]